MITKKQIEDILTKHQSKDYRSGSTVISVHDYGYVANDILAALNKVASSQPIIIAEQSVATVCSHQTEGTNNCKKCGKSLHEIMTKNPFPTDGN